MLAHTIVRVYDLFYSVSKLYGEEERKRGKAIMGCTHIVWACDTSRKSIFDMSLPLRLAAVQNSQSVRSVTNASCLMPIVHFLRG